MAKKLMEKVVRKVLRSFPKYTGPVCPLSIAYRRPPRVALNFVHVAERGNGPLGHISLCIDGFCLFVIMMRPI